MKKKVTILFGLLMALMLVMSACAQAQPTQPAKPSGSTEEPTKVSQSVAPTEAVVAEVVEETNNVFVYSSGTEPLTFDPQFITDVNTARASVQIHESLLTWDENSSIVPKLALSWTTSEDGLTWTFKLREGVTFHDGTPFNAEAVKYNIDRMQNPDTASPRASTIASISNVEVLGEFEVAITTSKPFGPLLSVLSTYNLGMMSPAALEKYGKDYATHPSGTGALMIKEFQPGQVLTMTKYDNYWGEKSTVDELKFTFVSEDASRVMMVMTGDADVIAGVPAIQVEQLETDKNVVVEKKTGYRTIYLGFNTNVPPFDDVRVRQALTYAIDKQSIIDNLHRGLATYPSGIESTVIAYSALDLDPYAYDLEKAKTLLAEAGYPDGFKTVIHTPEGRYPMDRQVAEVIQAMLAEVGVEAEIIVLDWGAYSELTTAGKDTRMFILGKGSPSGDPDYTLNLCYGTGAGMNTTQYSNPVIDALLAEERATTDTAKRAALLKEIQTIINDDAPQAVLYYEMQTFARRSDVNGLVIWPNEMIGLQYLTRSK